MTSADVLIEFVFPGKPLLVIFAIGLRAEQNLGLGAVSALDVTTESPPPRKGKLCWASETGWVRAAPVALPAKVRLEVVDGVSAMAELLPTACFEAKYWSTDM